MDGRANPLMDRKVVGVVLFGVVAMVAVVTSLTTPGCSVVVVVVVVGLMLLKLHCCSCSCGCSCSML